MPKENNTNFLQSKIEERAEERLKEVLKKTQELLCHDPILSQLQLSVTKSGIDKLDNSQPIIDKIKLIGHYDKAFFDKDCDSNLTKSGKKYTNIDSVMEVLRKQYIKEEGNQILEKLNVLQEYLR